MKSYNKNICKSLDIARRLFLLADKGEAASRDDSCMLLYGIIRDCAYKIKMNAESEKNNHKRKGLWDGGDEKQCNKNDGEEIRL